MCRVMRKILFWLFGLSIFGLILGFAGRFHGLGDSMAVLRPVFISAVAVLSVVFCALRAWGVGVVGLCLAGGAALGMMPEAPLSVVPDEDRLFSVYQKNLLFRLPDISPVAEDILRAEADFVMLQEVHQQNRAILDELRGAYPYQSFCPFAGVGGPAVLSRWPVVDVPACHDGSGFVGMRVETPDGLLWIASLHLHWPFPYRQPEQLATVIPVLEGLEGPVLIGGDFNMVPWSYAVTSVAAASKTKLVGYPGGTFSFSYHQARWNLMSALPRLPIDHVLIPEAGAMIDLERRPRFGSDHHGIVAEFILGVGSAQ